MVGSSVPWYALLVEPLRIRQGNVLVFLLRGMNVFSEVLISVVGRYFLIGEVAARSDRIQSSDDSEHSRWRLFFLGVLGEGGTFLQAPPFSMIACFYRNGAKQCVTKNA